jgi:hypothetical protein
MPRQRAASSTDSPAKKRNSTSRALARVLRPQLGQRLVQRQQIVGPRFRWWSDSVERDALPATSMLQALLPPRALDQDATHRLSRGGEEMAAIVPVTCSLNIHQPEVGLMDEGRRL